MVVPLTACRVMAARLRTAPRSESLHFAAGPHTIHFYHPEFRHLARPVLAARAPCLTERQDAAQRNVGLSAGALSLVPALPGPAAPRSAAGRQAGPVGRRAADATRSRGQAWPVSRPNRGGVPRLAAADTGPQPGRCCAPLQPGQTGAASRRRPGELV